MTKEELQSLRRAFRDYRRSEGCGCCRGEKHSEHAEVIARLLGVPMYSDGSGWNFSGYELEEAELRELFGDE